MVKPSSVSNDFGWKITFICSSVTDTNTGLEIRALDFFFLIFNIYEITAADFMNPGRQAVLYAC